MRLAIFLLFTFLGFEAFSQEQLVIPKKGIDTVTAATKITPLEIRKSYPFARFSATDSLLFKLDSLARPFYTIEYDPIQKDLNYTPKYRIFVNELNGDTTYIPLPKAKGLIAYTPKLKIDTLKIIDPIKPAVIDTLKKAADPVWWAYKNSFAFDISEAAFVNWNAGGNNSISGLLKLSFEREYKRLYVLWKNEVKIRYGLNSQEDQKLRKTDDQLYVNSTFGYRTDTISNWYYSVKFNFRTQFTDGFNYPNTDDPISRFFAPAYLFLGAGAQYELKKEQFFVYLSPVTLKSTIVADRSLSDEGAFGVDPGKRSRNEFGFLVQSSWDTKLVKNVIMKNDLTLYSDYLRKFGNTDIRYDLALEFIINKYIKANLSAHIIYDDDIKYKEDIDNDGVLDVLGPRIQLKQLLGIGVAFNF
ncbi:MAG: DUF3078 domain-containing protein [Flavobacteriaceae bacterium]|nr:DUF3078 domain-containing protein [Flavobacteriaceae bacterium]